MSFHVVLNSYAEYPPLRTSTGLDAAAVLNHKSQQQRIWNIVASVICALAVAIFITLAALAFAALAQAVVAVSIFALPAFMPLAVGLIASISAIGLTALCIKKCIHAHHCL